MFPSSVIRLFEETEKRKRHSKLVRLFFFSFQCDMEGYSDEGGEEAVYMCVLDFEATCDNDGSFNPQEIIEVWLPLIRETTSLIVW